MASMTDCVQDHRAGVCVNEPSGMLSRFVCSCASAACYMLPYLFTSLASRVAAGFSDSAPMGQPQRAVPQAKDMSKHHME